MMRSTVEWKIKVTSGINFSMLARNAGKFYGTKIIGIENTSIEVSPIKSMSFNIFHYMDQMLQQFNIFIDCNKSPKWLSPTEIKSNNSIEKSDSEYVCKKENKRHIKSISSKYEKYCTKNNWNNNATENTKISISKEEIQNESNLKFLKCQLEKQIVENLECFDEMTFISRNENEIPNKTSNKSHPFSANVQTISLYNTQYENTDYFGSGPNSNENEWNSDDNELAVFGFKNEDLQIKKLNKSSPNKNYLSDIDTGSEEIKQDRVIQENKGKSELISIYDNFHVLNNQPFDIDLEKSKEKFNRLRDFSSKSKEKSFSPVIIKMNVKSSLSNQLESSLTRETKTLKSIENFGSRSSSIDKGCLKSLENLPLLLSSNKKSSKIKTTESRYNLSDRISKFYFQKQTSFANENEAFDLIRKQLYPSFLNDKDAERVRIRSVEASESKYDKKIVTPSKIITELFEHHDSSTKPIIDDPSSKKRHTKHNESIEKEPLQEYWDVMNKDKNRNSQIEHKENMIKKLFDQRTKYLNK